MLTAAWNIEIPIPVFFVTEIQNTHAAFYRIVFYLYNIE